MILFLIIILVYILLLGISPLVRPRAEHIAKRQIPLKRFNQLGTLVRIGAIFLDLLIVPTTIISAFVSYKLSKDMTFGRV